jgi:hypothetical protein
MKDLTSSEAFLVSNKKQWDFYLQIKLFHTTMYKKGNYLPLCF